MRLHFLSAFIVIGLTSLGVAGPKGKGTDYQGYTIEGLEKTHGPLDFGPYGYAGLSLGTKPEEFKRKYPNSSVHDGTVWVSKQDSRDHVHFIEKRNMDGKDQIKIIFEIPEDQLAEKPQSWEAGHYARHPKCSDVLNRLTAIYRKPHKEHAWVEESLNHVVRTWSRQTETMSLDCYTIEGKGEQLALELIIR